MQVDLLDWWVGEEFLEHFFFVERCGRGVELPVKVRNFASVLRVFFYVWEVP